MTKFVKMDNKLGADVLELIGVRNPSKHQLSVINAILSTVITPQQILFHPNLSPREQSCLYWSAMGKTSEEIAEMFNLQKQTIDGYKKRILQRLGCKNITQSVFEGMRLGYLEQAQFKTKF